MDFYNVFGTVNTLFIIMSLYGVYSQLNTIWNRKRSTQAKESPTSLLSLNQFTVSYLAYLSFFIYGYSIAPFNHYIVWPRLIASLLMAGILYEIWQDRKTRSAKLSFSIASATLFLAVCGLFAGHSMTDPGRFISTAIIIIVSVLIAQGYFHQIKLVIHSGSTGAIDLKMSQFILLMDLSTIAFALSMGIALGWPLLVLAITSGITKLIIMFLFRWVRTSPVAQQRRHQATI